MVESATTSSGAQEPVVGIDLGTTFSLVAWVDATGRPTTIMNAEGDLTTPSVAFFDRAGVVVGKEAARAAEFEPERVAQFAKRDMGRISFHKSIRGEPLPPEVIQALVLKKLREDAELKVGPVTKAVVTVPAYFDEPRRKATEDAGRLAGLDVLDILNEPTAAAISFGVQQGFVKLDGGETSKETVLVYDLGGGTFDVTLMEIEGHKFTALATAGDVYLGGVDWTERIVDLIGERFMDEHNVDPRIDEASLRSLQAEAESAKRALTAREEVTLMFAHDGCRLRTTISRAQFEEMTGDLRDRTLFTVRKVLREADKSWADVTRLLLVGGSSRMPAVQSVLEEESGLKVDRSLSPDEAVAHGAAVYATLLSGKKTEHIADISVKNVNSHDLGVLGVETETGRNRRRIMIPRNTQLPCKAKSKFKTFRDGQKSVVVNVVEGGDDSGNNATPIGKCNVTGLPKDLPAKTPVEVTFRYTRNGRINVEAILPTLNHKAEMVIERATGLDEAAITYWKARVDQGLTDESLTECGPPPGEQKNEAKRPEKESPAASATAPTRAEESAPAEKTEPPKPNPAQTEASPRGTSSTDTKAQPKTSPKHSKKTRPKQESPVPDVVAQAQSNLNEESEKNAAPAKQPAPTASASPASKKTAETPPKDSSESTSPTESEKQSAVPTESPELKQEPSSTVQAPPPAATPPKIETADAATAESPQPSPPIPEATPQQILVEPSADGDSEEADPGDARADIVPETAPAEAPAEKPAPSKEEPPELAVGAAIAGAASLPFEPEDAVDEEPADEVEPPEIEVSEVDEEWLAEEQARQRNRALIAMGVNIGLHAALLLVLATIVYSAPSKQELFEIVTSISDEVPDEIVEEVEIQPDQIEEETKTEVITDVITETEDQFQIDVNDLAPSMKNVEEAPSDNGSSMVAPITGEMGGRSQAGKTALVNKYGGTSESEAAVAAGLSWLKKHQLPTGGWHFNHINAGCDGTCGQPGTLKQSTVGATAMALLAYMGAGHTYTDGEHQRSVEAGLNYMLKNAKVVPAGLDVRADFEGNGGMYIQGIAAICLSEAAAMNEAALLAMKGKPGKIGTKPRKQAIEDTQMLKQAAQGAINFIVNSQNQTGGWHYRPEMTTADTSVVGWQVMALVSGKSARLIVPGTTLSGVQRYLLSVTPDGGAQFGYSNRKPKPSTSAIGLLCSMYLGKSKEDGPLAKGVALLSKRGPQPNDMYYNYYATQVMHHWGGEEWTKWNNVMREQLVNSQIKKGHGAGSWNVADTHGGSGGRLYMTCLATMTLEVYYRHLPLYDHIEGIAAR